MNNAESLTVRLIIGHCEYVSIRSNMKYEILDEIETKWNFLFLLLFLQNIPRRQRDFLAR